MTGSQQTAAARAAAIYVAMEVAREATTIKEISNGGDDTDAMMRATRAALGSMDSSKAAAHREAARRGQQG